MDPRPPQIPGKKTQEALTPEQRRHIENFESLPLGWRGKMNLILTFLGHKKASDILFEPDISEEALAEAKRKIEEAGLLFVDAGVRKDETYGNSLKRTCFVAHDRNDLNSISTQWFGDYEKDPRVYKELGRVSGFPQTAIDAFDQFQREKRSPKDLSLSEKLFLTEAEKWLFPFEQYIFSSFFRMSRAHWEEELETAKKWAEALKAADPKLYMEVLNT